jgi:hypothetical protein
MKMYIYNVPCFLASVSVNLCSRLVLHLCEVASPVSDSSLESISVVNFATRIELGTSIDDHSGVQSVESSR